MIVDCYTHTWESPDELGRCQPINGHGHDGPTAGILRAGNARHLAAAEPVDTTIVLGFKSHYLAAEVSNARIAEYVGNHPDRLIAFAGIDPSNPRLAIEEMLHARDELKMPGLAVAPAAQDFHPSNSQAMRVYTEAAQLGMPILFHNGMFLTAATKLEYAQPVLLDEVARELPSLKIVIGQMGAPWIHETLALLAKHRNVFAEISGLLHQPWLAYQALLSASQSGVIDRLLFGSGFPRASAAQYIEELYHINHLVHGTNLPTIPRDQLRGIVSRDALGLLGIAPRREPSPIPAGLHTDDDGED